MADFLPIFGAEDAMASQILEIIGGITPKALQTLEETCNETDAWSMEEGDDSVFYSDEEDTPQSQVAILETRRRVNSEADETQLQEDEREERSTESVHCIAQETESMDTGHVTEHANTSAAISEVLESTHDEDSQSINADSTAQSSSNDLTDFSSDPVASHLQSGTYHPSLEVYRKPEEKSQSRLQHVSQDSSQGQSIPALSKKKSSHPKSFNHLTSSKYSSMSYRKIRHGNTRKKIEEFEYMIMHL